MQAPNTTAILHTTNRSHPESRCPPLPSSVRPMPACIGSVHLSICHNHDEVVRARDKLPGRKQRIKMERRQREHSGATGPGWISSIPKHRQQQTSCEVLLLCWPPDDTDTSGAGVVWANEMPQWPVFP